jgi:uncharacterized protein with FMN-binding domain
MSSNTKIVVLRSKELIYALIFLVLSVLIIIAALSVFTSKDDTSDNTTNDNTVSMDNLIDNLAEAVETSGTSAIYVPGIYSSVVSLGDINMELNIAVDYDHINSITMSNLDEAVETLYPLMSPTLSELSETILADQSTENVTYPDENRYTSMLLMQAINEALDKARIKDTDY